MTKVKFTLDSKNNFFTNNKITVGTTIPTSGTHKAGDIVVSTAPNSNAYGWICTTTGTPGTWKVLKSASDLPTVNWGNVTNKPSTFNAQLGYDSKTAIRGDLGNHAYNHSQSAHAPVNAQRNADITKAEIEAKLTGNVTTHTHSGYATANHGRHLPAREEASNTTFLGNTGEWSEMDPNDISGASTIQLPPCNSKMRDYVKIATLPLTPDGTSHAEFLVAGVGNFGNTGHYIGIIRASGRGEGSVSVDAIIDCDARDFRVGYTKSKTFIDVWLNRHDYDGAGSIIVTSRTPNVMIHKHPGSTTTVPLGYIPVFNSSVYDYMKKPMIMNNNVCLMGTDTNHTGHNIIGVDSHNNILVGYNSGIEYLNVNNTIRARRDMHVEAIHAKALRVNSGGFNTIYFGEKYARVEYSVGDRCVYFAGDENEFGGYRLPFRAQHLQANDGYVRMGGHAFIVYAGGVPIDVKPGDVLFRV